MIPFLDIIKHQAYKSKVDPYLIAAVIKTESAFNPFAVRFEPNYAYPYRIREMAVENKVNFETMEMMQNTSWGLCQIMGAVYYELGGTGFASKLLNPTVNVEMACKILKKLASKEKSFSDIYAAYNRGSVAHKPDGSYVNQQKVDNFLACLAAIRSESPTL